MNVYILLLITIQMTSRSELTLFKRGEIIGAWKCGLSEEKISVALKRIP